MNVFNVVRYYYHYNNKIISIAVTISVSQSKHNNKTFDKETSEITNNGKVTQLF